ncbi:sporulation protein [bacterium]|nr:sporulation protein [bacterium]
MANVVNEIIATILDKLEGIAKTKTILGDPITVKDMTVLPVSKISFGFGAGGGEGNIPEEKKGSGSGGGGGGGASITPVAFIVIKKDDVVLLPVKPKALAGIVEAIPDVLEKMKELKDKKKENKE